MNGGPQREPSTTAAPNSQPSAAIIPTTRATLRSLQTQNISTINHVIAQLDTLDEIQNEVVNARAAHAQVSRDLRKAVDQNMQQSKQLRETQEALHATDVKLHAARNQLTLVESELKNNNAQAAAREAEKDRQIQNLSSALQASNLRTTELSNKLLSVRTVMERVGTPEPTSSTDETLEAGSSSLRNLDKWLSSLAKDSDDPDAVAHVVAASIMEPADSSSTSDGASSELYNLSTEAKNEIYELVKSCFQESKIEKQQTLLKLRSTHTELNDVLLVAQASASRNLTLESAFKTIAGLGIWPPPSATGPPFDSGAVTEVGRESVETQRTSRQPSIPAPIASPRTSLSSTPVHQSSMSPRKRPRTSTSVSIPESLPQDDELRGLISFVNTVYDIRHANGENGGVQHTAKRLFCKACNRRHQDQPNYPVTSFEYGQDDKLAVPPLANAEPTRARIEPWVAHMRERHQKAYTGFMDKWNKSVHMRRNSSASLN